jgi:predicted nucleic acid-binding protein
VAALYVLDAYALIAFFEDEPGADFVRSLLLDAAAGNVELSLSVVNLGEIWYSVARSVSVQQADAVVQEIQGLTIDIVDAGWSLAYQAAQFKARGGLSYADCYAAALASLRGATLITGDPEFAVLSDAIPIAWPA